MYRPYAQIATTVHQIQRSINNYPWIPILLGGVALVAQRPIVIKLSRERSVGRSVRLSVCPVHCGKTVRMPFGIVGRTGPGIRQVVGFGDRFTGRGTFGGEFGAHHCPQGPKGRTCATAPRRSPLAKLLCANLLLFCHVVFCQSLSCYCSYYWFVMSSLVFQSPETETENWQAKGTAIETGMIITKDRVKLEFRNNLKLGNSD